MCALAASVAVQATEPEGPFAQAIQAFHQAEQTSLSAAEALDKLAAIEARYALDHPARKIVIDAERCAYTAFATPEVSRAYIADGIARAKRARMPISENVFRLCELTLQGATLELDGVDGLVTAFNALEAPYQKGKAYALRADVASVRGDTAEAVLDYQNARAEWERAGITGLMPDLAIREAGARRRMADYEGTETLLTRVLTDRAVAGHPRALALAHIQLGFLRVEAGNPALAIGPMMDAVKEARLTQDRALVASALVGLGMAQIQDRQLDPGLESVSQALSLLDTNSPSASRDLGLAYYLQGIALTGKQQLEPAAAALDQAQMMFERIRSQRMQALALRARAALFEAQHQPERALQTYRDYMALELRRQTDMRLEQSALLSRERTLQSQAYENREQQVSRRAQEQQLAALKSGRRWQLLALFATLCSLVLVGHFAWQQWRRGRRLNVMAHMDPLTQLANRNGLERFALTQIEAANAQGTPLTLLMLDLDHFKQINDAHGHLVGDIVLKEVTRAWSEALRAQDLLGRFGGEEFLLLCPGMDVEKAIVVAERLRTACHSIRLGAIDADLKISVSIGIAQYVPGESRGQWINRADRALYRAKHSGRDRIEIAEDAA